MRKKEKLEGGIYQSNATEDILVVCGENVTSSPCYHVEDGEVVSALVLTDETDESEVTLEFDSKEEVYEIIGALEECARAFDKKQELEDECMRCILNEFYQALSDSEKAELKLIVNGK